MTTIAVPLRTSAVILVVLGAALAVAVLSPTRSTRQRAQRAAMAVPAYVAMRDDLDARLAWLARRAERTGLWLDLQMLGEMHLSRAQLSGRLEDYLAADAGIERAFALAPAGAGPFQARARLSLALHRIDRVEADVAAFERCLLLKDRDLAAIADLRAQVAFARGDYSVAEAGFRRSIELDPTPGNLFNLAQVRWKSGDFTGAELLLDQAESTLAERTGHTAAWLRLQRGLIALDQGDHAVALAEYRIADARFPGWWLVEEHIAEARAALGETDAAITAYRDLIARTGDPEFMDALAPLLEATGAHDEAAQLRARSDAAFTERFALLPEAAAGHALGHWLERDGAEATRLAVELAERNHALRPNGEAGTLLARAYLKAGRTDDARTVIERTLATIWRSTELHATAMAVYQAAGETGQADEHRAAALAINPHALD
ncbi:MAG TPA: tetratricopeptide repeat protein [Planctomycetota bacterium]|nr:tetratricopeptide repeat protein [Planctomycetota bacterium]